MATTYTENGTNTPNGSHLEFSYTFPAIKQTTEDVKVALNGATQATTKYTVNSTSNPTKITFNNTSIDSTVQESTGAPKTGVLVRVYRDTEVDTAEAVYAAGSSIRAADLNNNQDQALYALQEEQNLRGWFSEISLDDDVKIKFGNSDDFTIEVTNDDAELVATSDIVYKVDGAHKFRNGSNILLNIWSSYADFKIDVRPYNDDTYDLGSSSYQWKDLWIDGTAHIDTLDVDENAQIDGNATVSGHTTTSTLQVNSSVSSNLIPHTHANYNLGATNIRWGNAYINTVNGNDITGDAVVTTGTSTSDTKVYSAKRCDELYYNIGTAEEIVSGETWVADDAKIATTAAIDARIVDLVDEVGGFVPIANETSFPNANPDVNNSAGTIVSIGVLASNHTSSGSGVITISNGTVGNSTVTINGAANSTTYSAGYGLLVETTSTLNTYTFHRLSSKATEVTTVASNITEIQRLGTADAVADMNLLGTTAIVEDMNLLGTAACVADMATIADTSNLISNIGTVAGNNTNVTTVAGISANVTTVAGIDSDVTAVAGDATDIGLCSTNIGSIAAIGSDLANNFENITDYGSITGAVTSTSGTSDITTVADDIADVSTVAGKATEIGRLGTADAVADMVLLGTTDCIADMAILATADVVSDLNTLGTADVVSDLNTLATSAIVSDMDTLADISTNITTVADNDSNVTTCASNITNINNASTHAANALAYRNAASGIMTQNESLEYNLSDSVSSHTDWGAITDSGTAYFSNEAANTLLTMSTGSSSYNYGSIT